MYTSRQDAIPKGKKIVLRVDNVLKNSRNGNSGMERMKRIAEKSDLIIYQSEWAKSYLSPYLKSKAKEVVIVNGGDSEIFNKEVPKLPKNDKTIYLYSRSSNNESKMWEIAWSNYQDIHQKNKNTQLWIMGRFSPQNLEHNWDFFNGEDWKFLGFPTDRSYLSMVYQSADYLMFPHFREACPNTLIEWLLVKGTDKNIIFNETGYTGGTVDIINGFKKYGYEWLKNERMIKEYVKEMELL